MAEFVSALNGLISPRPYDQEKIRVAGLWLKEIATDDIVQIGFFEPKRKEAEAYLKDALGRFRYSANTAYQTKTLSILPISCDKLLAVSHAGSLMEKLAGLPNDLAVATPLGHAKTILRIGGPAAPTLVSRGLMLDLHENAFPKGRVAVAPIHDVPIILHHLKSTEFFDLYIPRSFAEDIVEWILIQGKPFGIEFLE